MILKNYLYAATIAIILILAIDIWTLVNTPGNRSVGFMLWEGIATIIILLAGLVLSYARNQKGNNGSSPNGMIFAYSILIFSVIVAMNLAPSTTQIERLTFYFHLFITAATVILVSFLGNATGIEKADEDGFKISVHDKSSPIPAKWVIPTWIVTFLFMGMFVGVSGIVLLSYPVLGAADSLTNAALAGFAVASPENIIFCILIYEAVSIILKRKKFGIPENVRKVTAGIAGIGSFAGFHQLVYQTNMQAMFYVLGLGAFFIVTYIYFKSIVIMDAIHCGNNFWGAFFQKNVIGGSVLGGSPEGSLITSLIILITTILFVVAVVKIAGRGKKMKGVTRNISFLVIGAILFGLLGTASVLSVPSNQYYISSMVEWTDDQPVADITFSSAVKEELDAKWDETWWNNTEFFAYLEVRDGEAVGVEFIGEKDILTGKIELHTPYAEPTGYELHSHPTGICLQSDIDKNLGTAKVACVQCGPSRIRCFEHG